MRGKIRCIKKRTFVFFFTSATNNEASASYFFFLSHYNRKTFSLKTGLRPFYGEILPCREKQTCVSKCKELQMQKYTRQTDFDNENAFIAHNCTKITLEVNHMSVNKTGFFFT